MKYVTIFILTGVIFGLVAIPLYLFFGYKVAVSVWCLLMFANIVNLVQSKTLRKRKRK